MKLVLSSKPKENIFTTSGTFTVPDGINEIEVFCVGGGECGDSGNFSSSSSTFGNGGGGGYTTTGTIDTSSNKTINIAIGVGGQQYYRNSAWTRRAPGTSSAGSVSAKGGSLPNGGSAGGHGYLFADDRTDNGNGAVRYKWATDGASDGGSTSYYWSDTYWNTSYSGTKSWGTGQGTTTRAFEEPDGTLYAGGGGGGWCSADSNGSHGTGYGGAGGGGNGAYNYTQPTQGGAGTGGGGGGGVGWALSDYYWYGADGGSGCVIIRW